MDVILLPSNGALLAHVVRSALPLQRQAGAVTPTTTQRQVPTALGETVIDLDVDGSGPSITVIREAKGVVYTKPWVVDLILDLAGYCPERDLASIRAVEPSAGEGAFLLPMIRRLIASLEAHGRPLTDARDAISAYELDDRSAALLTNLAAQELRHHGVEAVAALSMASRWVTVGDYLLASPEDRHCDIVVGNPPYIRYDDLPEGAFSAYRAIYPTMIGRGDIYIGFIEAGLRQLKEEGVLTFICADRWMRSAYGAELRELVANTSSLDVMIEMHNAPAFENEVSAYPAIIVLRKGKQGDAIVASADATAGPDVPGRNLAEAIFNLADDKDHDFRGFTATRMARWFSGKDPWPSLDPPELVLLQALEGRFHPLEDVTTGTKVGIGVATGNDSLYVTKDPKLVEPSRLLPLAMAADTRSGALKWSGHYLVDPWDEYGLVDLNDYPLLRAYFEKHQSSLEKRNIAKKNTRTWFRTIDRVNHRLMTRDKLYFPDMKMASNPTLDRGETYPHHNLYYLVSDTWDLEVLGGLLLSRVAQLFIEAYCVRMRGGTLRFQAQYLRRIRVPEPTSIDRPVLERLRKAFRARDAQAATKAAIEAYGISEFAELLGC